MRGTTPGHPSSGIVDDFWTHLRAQQAASHESNSFRSQISLTPLRSHTPVEPRPPPNTPADQNIPRPDVQGRYGVNKEGLRSYQSSSDEAYPGRQSPSSTTPSQRAPTNSTPTSGWPTGDVGADIAGEEVPVPTTATILENLVMSHTQALLKSAALQERVANIQDHEKDLKLMGLSDTSLQSCLVLNESLRTMQILDTLVGGSGHKCGGEHELQMKKVVHLYQWFNSGGPTDIITYWSTRRVVVSTELIVALGLNMWKDLHPTLITLEDNMSNLANPSFHRNIYLKKLPALTGPDWSRLPTTWDEVMKLYKKLFLLYSDVYGYFWFVRLPQALEEFDNLRNSDPQGFFGDVKHTTQLFQELLVRAQLKGLTLVTSSRSALFDSAVVFDAELAVQERPIQPIYAHVKSPTDVEDLSQLVAHYSEVGAFLSVAPDSEPYRYILTLKNLAYQTYQSLGLRASLDSAGKPKPVSRKIPSVGLTPTSGGFSRLSPEEHALRMKALHALQLEHKLDKEVCLRHLSMKGCDSADTSCLRAHISPCVLPPILQMAVLTMGGTKTGPALTLPQRVAAYQDLQKNLQF